MLVKQEALYSNIQNAFDAASKDPKLHTALAPALMLTADYPQFALVEPPRDGLTVSAWRGVLKPFETDAVARSILCDMEAERTLWISEGTIRPSASTQQHWAHPLLVSMNVSCEVCSARRRMRCRARPRLPRRRDGRSLRGGWMLPVRSRELLLG